MKVTDREKVQALYSELLPFFGKFAIGDAKFISKNLSIFPRQTKHQIMRIYSSYQTRRERNLFLLRLSEATIESLPSCIDSLDRDSEEIKRVAEMKVEAVTRIANQSIYRRYDRQQVSYTYTGDVNSDKILYTRLKLYIEKQNLTPPDLGPRQDFAGCIRKMLCIKTWNRQLQTKVKRARERLFIAIGKVSNSSGLYISDFGAEKRKYEKIANEEFLASSYMKNSKGEIVNLLKLSNATVANPVNRRNELMTRLRGAEEEANRRGDVGLFITITCPSRFHSTLSTNGQQNPRWDGSTPRQASEYLSGVWQKVRAALNRQGIRMYGIRISEPQHDATPHWHMLVFVPPEDKEYLISVIKNYAMQDSPDEPGAAKYRFDVAYIDKKKGGATSYIAKYISKNIDGFGLEKEDNDILIKAFRVEAWASCWGIRQFQSFGLPFITGWRELRKVRQELPESSPFHLSHTAADSGDFAGYIRAMGGVCTPARKRPIKLLYDANFDKETGEVRLGQYDREPLFKVVGLQSNGKHLITRAESWHRCSESGAA